MKAFRTIILLAVVAALFVGGSNRPVAAQDDRAGWPSNFIVGIFAGEDPGKALTGFEPMRAYLEETLGIRTVMYTGGSYTAVITAMQASSRRRAVARMLLFRTGALAAALFACPS